MKLEIDDWRELSPLRFEQFCADLLAHLGFENVRRLGGSGDKGRDIVCERTIEFAPGVSGRCNWIVQCRHTPEGLSKSHLMDAMASAVEHRCDFWWLMTSAVVTSGFADWLRILGRTNAYPFRTSYLDREMLARLVAQFPQLAATHFPQAVDAVQRNLAEAMAKMSQGEYYAAREFLEEKDDAGHPRFSYLLACCFSMMARDSRGMRSTFSAQAFKHLAEASKRNYVQFMSDSLGWPESKCLFEIHRDPELQFLKQSDHDRFSKVFREPDKRGGGGCFPGNTLVSLSPRQVIPISLVRPREHLLSLVAPSGYLCSEVRELRSTRVFHWMRLNCEVDTTLEHRFHTVNGWRRAGHLSVGDLLTTEEGPRILQSVEFRDGAVEVFNASLYGLRHYYANGYLVHNDKI